MVLVAISKLGCTELFIDPGAKVNDSYRDILLTQHMIPVIRRVSGDHFISWIAFPHIVHMTRCTTPDFIVPDVWPPNLPDLNPIDYAIWSVTHQRVYETRVMTSMSCDSVYCMCGAAWSSR